MLLLLWFIGGFLSATVSGAAGFGGAILLLPLLTHTMGAEQAVPLLTLAQLVSNLSRIALGFRQIAWGAVARFLVSAIPFGVLGAVSFVTLREQAVFRLIGVGLLVFLLLRWTGHLEFRGSPRFLYLGGGLVGFPSGLVGTAGPLGAAVFLSLRLPPVSYIASEAAAAFAMHVVKSIVYRRSIHLGQGAWVLAAVLGIAMVAGTWAGKWIIERTPLPRFQRMVEVLLGVVAVLMVVG